MEMIDPVGLLALEVEEDQPVHEIRKPLLTPESSEEKTFPGETGSKRTNYEGKERLTQLSIPFLLESPPTKPPPFEHHVRKHEETTTLLIDSQFFLALTELGIIGRSFLRVCRCAEVLESPWSDVQRAIQRSDSKLLHWRSALKNLSFHRNQELDLSHQRRSLSLCLSYYSTRMVINRPSLYRLAKRIPSGSIESQNFDRQSADECVQAALDLLTMVPDDGHPTDFFKVCPWFCLLQYFVQAAAVLLLYLSTAGTQASIPGVGDAVASTRKAVHWLGVMGSKSPVAEHAAVKVGEILHAVCNDG